jgi:hypothetical protein
MEIRQRLTGGAVKKQCLLTGGSVRSVGVAFGSAGQAAVNVLFNCLL